MQKKKSTLIMAGALLLGGMLLSAPASAGPTAEMLGNTCAGCHGTNGQSAGPAMPTLAGLPAEHIKLVMKEFKSGERPSTIMGRLAKGYSDEEIDLIAGFMSKQKWTNHSRVAQNQMGTMVDKNLAAKGHKLDKKCEKCHEDDGRSQEDDVPRLAGQWNDYLLFKMEEYKNGLDGKEVPQPKKMKGAMDKLSLEELKALAHYFASQQ